MDKRLIALKSVVKKGRHIIAGQYYSPELKEFFDSENVVYYLEGDDPPIEEDPEEVAGKIRLALRKKREENEATFRKGELKKIDDVARARVAKKEAEETEFALVPPPAILEEKEESEPEEELETEESNG